MSNPKPHQPVLLNEVLKLLHPRKGEIYLDLTAGYGGHAAEIISKTAPGKLVLVDRDKQAIEFLKDNFADAKLIHKSYLAAVRALQKENFKCHLILMDVGVSSPQLEKSSRGFSFLKEASLDMRMDERQSITAAHLVNKLSEKELADIIYRYGEERRSRQIARAILAKRPIQTTTELAEIVSKVVKGSGKVHPATRTFQALRIAVNEELFQLESTLPIALELLESGGRMAVISFHSLEDRIVKQFFRNASDQGKVNILTKKPLAGKQLDPDNPRARSAKLRAIEKN